ncbi:ArsR/SmtB family transcription factor [Prochlorothrix hollandica]|uniref:HTH arsR-type domain-containing protein n=1 Tax=Prochlorothrix hollandica PCC 9006 = CALU 1027 TaxID=317619 RepID=A0A0M2PXZ6_PROHO|nr:hypothetical protein PROH_13000 [Prochlorothrix hollandica PCC 9006 = CALU 1027]
MDRSPDPGANLRAGFHALSDPLRLEIMQFLRDQEACVCDIQTKLSIAPSKLSFHLKTLKNAKILRSRQEGRWIYYSLNLPHITALEQYLADFRRLSPIAPARTCQD